MKKTKKQVLSVIVECMLPEMWRGSENVGNAHRYVQEIQCNIKVWTHDDDCIDVGEASACLIATALMFNEGQNEVDVLDKISSDCRDVAHYLFDPDGNGLKDEIYDRFEVVSGSILFVKNICIFEPYRGKGLGLVALQAIFDQLLQGRGGIVLRAYPMQLKRYCWDEGDQGNPFDKSSPHRYDLLPFDLKCETQKKSVNKLIKHYKKIGFERLKGPNGKLSDFMFRNEALVSPEVELGEVYVEI